MTDDPERRFDEEWRRRAARPPGKSPAAAAAEVRARLSRQASAHLWRLPAAAVLVLALTAFLGVRLLNPPKTVPAPARVVGPVAVAPLAEGQVLIWLDEETPLYMTCQQPTGESR
jgi:hypothetical protein